MRSFKPFDRVRITMGERQSPYTQLEGTVVPFGPEGNPYVWVERDDLGFGSQPHAYLPHQLEHSEQDTHASAAGGEE